MSWKHSGFSIDNSIRIAASDNKAREAIAQYMALCPVSLEGKWQPLFCTSFAAAALGHPVHRKDWEHVAKLAPDGWKEQNKVEIKDDEKGISEPAGISVAIPYEDISAKKIKSTRARLNAKIYEIYPLTCPKG